VSASTEPVEVITLGEALVTMIATRRGPLAEASRAFAPEQRHEVGGPGILQYDP
jgi:hypothetical protein